MDYKRWFPSVKLETSDLPLASAVESWGVHHLGKDSYKYVLSIVSSFRLLGRSCPGLTIVYSHEMNNARLRTTWSKNIVQELLLRPVDAVCQLQDSLVCWTFWSP